MNRISWPWRKFLSDDERAELIRLEKKLKQARVAIAPIIVRRTRLQNRATLRARRGAT